MSAPSMPVSSPFRAPAAYASIAHAPLALHVVNRASPVPARRGLRALWLGAALCGLMAALSPAPGRAADLLWAAGDATPGAPADPADGDWSVAGGAADWWDADRGTLTAFEQGDAVTIADDTGGAPVTVRLLDGARVSALTFAGGDLRLAATGAGGLTGLADAALTVAPGTLATLETPVAGDFDLTVGGTFALTATGGGISSITVLAGGDLTVATPGGGRLVVAGGTVNEGRLTLTDGGTIQTQVDNRSWMTLIGTIAVDGALRNAPGAVLRLSGDIALGDGGDAAVVNETRLAAIAAGTGADVTVRGTFENAATGYLDGTGQPLRLTADRIVLRFGNRIGGDVRLSAGSILNEGRLDMAAAPVLGGRIDNAATGTLAVAGTVAGAGRDIVSSGRIEVAGTGALTDLNLLDTTGALVVAAGGRVSALRLWHRGGMLVSAGTLTGQVDLDAAADLSGTVAGRLGVGAGTTRLTGDLAVTDAAGVVVAAPARLDLTGGAVLTADRVEVAGILGGSGRIDGTLVLTGAARVAAGAAIAVRDRVVAALSTPTAWSDLTGLATDALENRGVLTLDRAFAGEVVNEAGGTLAVTADLAGPLTSRGDLRLDGTGGAAVALGGPVTIAGGMARTDGDVRLTAPEALLVETPGSLRVATGGLTAEAGVAARGGLTVAQGATLTTPRLIVGGATAGTAAGRTTLAGRVEGTVEVRADGRLTLDGGTVTGRVTNAGTLDSAATGPGTITLGDGLRNSGTATLGVAGRAAVVTGDVVNTATGTADITAEVTGRLVNDGRLTAAGSARGLENRAGGVAEVAAGGTLTLATGARNAAGADLTVAGTLEGTLANAAGARAGIAAGGRVTGAVANDGALSLSGTAAGGVVNAAGGEVRVTGAGAGGAIDNRSDARVTIDAGARLTGELTNAAGGTVTGAGTVAGRVVNDGTIVADGALRVEGDLTNRGVLTDGASGGRLTVTGVLEQFGSIRRGGDAGVLEVVAGTIRIAGESSVGAGVRLVGRVLLAGDITYDEDRVLEGDLDLEPGATLSVAARVDGQGTANLGNEGTVIVADRGALVGMDRIANRNRMTIEGTIEGDRLVNAEGGVLISTGDIRADLVNGGAARLSGTVTGALANEGTGTVEIAAGTGLTVGGTLTSAGTLTVDGTLAARLENRGVATLNTRLEGAAVNGAPGDLTLARGATGGLANAGTADVAGTFGGALSNGATGTMAVTGDLAAVGMTNAGGLTMTGGTATLRDGLATAAGSGTVIGADATLRGDLTNAGTTLLSGRIEGRVANLGGRLALGADADARIDGALANGVRPLAMIGPGPATGPGTAETVSRVTIAAGRRLTVADGTVNAADARMDVDGTLVSRVQNLGRMDVTGRIDGAVTTAGGLNLAGGVIDGDLTYRGGGLTMTDGGRATGALSVRDDLSVARGEVLAAGGGIVTEGAVALAVAGGQVAGEVTNAAGRVALSGGAVLRDGLRNGAAATLTAAGAARIDGALANDGTVSLQNERAGDVLRLGGLSGRGVYALDLDLDTRDGANGADRIAVAGGPVTGHVQLRFSVTDLPAGPMNGRPITILDVSKATGTVDFTYDTDGLPTDNERIVYGLRRDARTGSIELTYGTNASISGLSGNIVLTQSLIGSVVNRPSSPFVTGYALAEGEAPCAPGGWARAIGGRADATGSSATGGPDGYRVDSAIGARYAGVQFGGDMACFDGHVGGWNMAFGVIGGVNDGSTRQPVYLLDDVDGRFVQTDRLGSVNTADFRQLYGGVYVTATRDRLSADLQLRRERTAFTLTNTPVIADSAGLGITDARFDSDAVTLSGSLSYALPLGRQGWQLVPTAGFAWSRITTDPIPFDQGERLEIRDTTSRVGFLGATLSRGRVLASGTEAVNYYATGTIYRDFAGGTRSDFVIPTAGGVGGGGGTEVRERLTSDNLGTYGEIGIGASYTRVLQPGAGGKPRQVSASVRLDGRSGASLDSYGITAQLRLQF